MNNEREERIRERAHQIWEREGRANGQEQIHWERASREIDEEDRSSERASNELKGAPSSRAGARDPRNVTDDTSGGKDRA